VSDWKVRCEQCGHENDLPETMKRSIIKIYEAATGKVLLPEPGARHKRREMTPFGRDRFQALCGYQSRTAGELHWSCVTCRQCLERRR
jgi:hypothetical protein